MLNAAAPINKRNLFQLPTVEQDWESINNIFEVLSKNFKIYRLSDQEKSALENQIKEFSLLQNYESVFFIDAISLNRGSYNFNLLLLTINSEVAIKNRYHIRKEHIAEYEFVAFFNLKKSFDHVIIRPETLGDKISELFKRVEIDFEEEKEFSGKYFLTSSNDTQVKESFSRGILNSIGANAGVYAEVKDNQMLLQLKKRMSQENTAKLAALAQQILENE